MTSKAQEETVYLSFTGTVDIQQSVDIVPEINGEVVDIYVPSVSKVNKGDALLKLKEYDYFVPVYDFYKSFLLL